MDPTPTTRPATRDLRALYDSGVSLLVGTCDAEAIPHSMRATGLRFHDDDVHVTVYLPEVTSRNTVTDVAVNPRVAVLMSHPLTHRSFQLKGTMVSLGAAPDSEQPFVEAYLSTFAHVLEHVGMPYEVVTMISHWPSIALVMRVEAVYLQTPGPGAGAQLLGPNS